MGRREVALSEYLDEQREAAGFFINLGDDTVVIDPPLLWPDNWAELSEAGDARGLLVAVFGGGERGEGQLERFLAAGGNLTMGVGFLYEQLGVPLGESKASSPSSTNDGVSSRPTSDASTPSTSSTPGDLVSLGGGSPVSSATSPASPPRTGRSTPRAPRGVSASSS